MKIKKWGLKWSCMALTPTRSTVHLLAPLNHRTSVKAIPSWLRNRHRGSREKRLQIRIESHPETSMSDMGETEVIICLPNGSWPCELSTVTKSKPKMLMFWQTPQGQFQRDKFSRTNPNVGEKHKEKKWLWQEELKTPAAGGCCWLLKEHTHQRV